MIPAFIITFGLVAITAFAAVAARRLKIPHSILLVLVGLGLAFVPAVPRVAIKPDFVLMLLLPPLLYSSGVGMSWPGFKANLRPIMLLAVGCVLFTATAVALVAHYLLGLSWAVGFVLGAVVSPPDAVAPMAIARRLAIPERILTILEGEGLVNDATALILFSFAVAAVGDGHFSFSAALGEFFVIVAGELAWGLTIGWVTLRLRRWARDPQVEIALALLTPFAAFWPPEMLGGSGVLATVTVGLYVSWNGPRYISSATRLQGYFVWDLVVYLVEGVIFLLTGLQARVIADGLDTAQWQRLAIAVGAVNLVVILIRFVWVLPAVSLSAFLSKCMHKRHRHIPWQQSLLVGYTGIRGVVSLAAALSIPLMAGDKPFPDGGLILLVTFCVILVTLVGQGSLFPFVVRALGLADAGTREAAAAKAREVSARIAGIDAVLARLDEFERDGISPEAVAALKRRHTDRRVFFVDAEENILHGTPASDYPTLQLRLVDTERRRVAELYDAGTLDDGARRRVERELDLEESRMRHAAESGAGRLD